MLYCRTLAKMHAACARTRIGLGGFLKDLLYTAYPAVCIDQEWLFTQPAMNSTGGVPTQYLNLTMTLTLNRNHKP